MTDEDASDDGPDREPGDESLDRDPFNLFDADEYRDRRGDPFESLGQGNGQPASGPEVGDDVESPERRWSTPDGDDAFTFPGDSDRERTEHHEAESREADHRDADAGRDGDESREGRGSREPGTDGVRSDVGIPSGDPFSDVDREGESPFESGTNAFEEVDVEDVDADEVWESLVGGGGESTGSEEVEVSKHAYCEGCEYFSKPPDVHCNHEGTEILEFVDMNTVRVLDCPVVIERRELEQE